MSKELTRTEIEDFLFYEAECLDRWQLDEWLALWEAGEDVAYQVAPTTEENLEILEPTTSMFLIADNRYRLEHRIIRMKKKSFHAEYHRSRTRHLYGNVRIRTQNDKLVKLTLNASVFRTKNETTVVYPSLVRMTLRKTPQGLRIVKKRIELDLDRLANFGALTILL